MKFIGQILEQLKEAGHQIDNGVPTSSRLALILTDNVLEILMYNLILEEFNEDDWLINIKAPKYSKKYRDDVKRHFPEKTKFINKNIGIISPEQVDIINICHKFRNEVYHRNVIRDLIIKQISKIYYKVCCNLFPELWMGDYSVSFDEELPDIFKEFEISICGFSIPDLKKASTLLCQNRQCSPEELSKALSKDLTKRLKQLDKNLKFLDSVTEDIPCDVLTWIQFVEEYSDYKAPDEIEKLLDDYKPNITFGKLESWKKQGLKLKSGRNSSKALNKFNILDKQLIEIEKIVDETVYSAESWIDIQTEAEMELRRERY